jgi:hypothetical protein
MSMSPPTNEELLASLAVVESKLRDLMAQTRHLRFNYGLQLALEEVGGAARDLRMGVVRSAPKPTGHSSA